MFFGNVFEFQKSSSAVQLFLSEESALTPFKKALPPAAQRHIATPEAGVLAAANRIDVGATVHPLPPEIHKESIRLRLEVERIQGNGPNNEIPSGHLFEFQANSK